MPPNVTTFTLDNLFEGESYLFRIAAENKAGRSVYLENENPVIAKLPFGTIFENLHLHLYNSVSKKINLRHLKNSYTPRFGKIILNCNGNHP